VTLASYSFVLVFLPIALAGFLLLRRQGASVLVAWLLAVSMVFYSWASPLAAIALVVSSIFNYAVGSRLATVVDDSRRRAFWLFLGVGINLAALATVKYAPLFDPGGGFTRGLVSTGIPLALSFYSFQQMSYLIDISRGDSPAPTFGRYLLFVSFFPKLLAGPIARARTLLPQLDSPALRFSTETLASGLTLFGIGLTKKVILADALIPYASVVFTDAAAGRNVMFADAWSGAVAYSLGLYFDFSGYSDMAVGVGLMFGIRLPINFDAPYRAANVRDFWRRWHRTLSNAFFDYVYLPFAMWSRRVTAAGAYAGLLVTMVLCGMWHGAGWTFVAWGALHGGYLMVNYGWRETRKRWRPLPASLATLGAVLSGAMTFLAVIIGWVIFRADDFPTALRMLRAMAAFGSPFAAAPVTPWILVGLAIVWLAPTSQSIVGLDLEGFHDANATRWWQWRPSPAWGIGTAMATIAALFFLSGRQGDFIYFKF